MVLAEECDKFFDGSTESPYMLLVAHLREQSRNGPPLDEARSLGLRNLAELQEAVTSDFTAISHVDYSSRVQTLNQTSSTRAYRLLRAFFEKTNCPMLLNTSFNVRGEPIVCTPDDAYRCFMRTEMDVLVVEDAILYKQDQPSWKEDDDWRARYDD